MSTHDITLDPATLSIPEGHALRKLPTIAFVIGAVGLLASIILVLIGGGGEGEHAVTPVSQFFFSYIVAFSFFLSIALGGLFFVLIQHAAKAGWSVTLRRIAENAMGTLPVFAALFAPIAIFGLGHLYEWTHEEHVVHDVFLSAKEPYLNIPFFIVRAVLIFGVWSLVGWWFRKESLIQDREGERDVPLLPFLRGKWLTTSTRRLQILAGPCIVLFAFSVTFAAFDWLMSLQPHWYSTIFGGYFFAGCVVAIMATLILSFTALQSAGFVGRAVSLEHFHDLGKLLFAFVVFWAYIAFSQFMLIWYANMPEETVFFEHRYEGSWMKISILLMVGHFIVPFFYLLPRTVKRLLPLLVLGALWMLVMHYVDLYWLVMPVLHPAGIAPSLLDLTTFLGVGGIFVGMMARLTVGNSLVAVGDPRLGEALAFENF